MLWMGLRVFHAHGMGVAGWTPPFRHPQLLRMPEGSGDGIAQ